MSLRGYSKTPQGKWMARFFSRDVLPWVRGWLGFFVYWLTVVICFRIGHWMDSDFGSTHAGFGLIVGLFLGHLVSYIFKAWIFGWHYAGSSFHEPPPGKD